MKLYKEEQVTEAMKLARHTDKTRDEIFIKLTPIELPSDEEIINHSSELTKNPDDYWISHKIGFVRGAKWMREQMLGKEDKTFKQKSKWTEVDNMTRRLK